MAYKNNRNSREDKSLKHSRFEGNSKKEQPEKPNSRKKKLFEEGAARPSGNRTESTEGNRKFGKNTGKSSFEGGMKKKFTKGDKNEPDKFSRSKSFSKDGGRDAKTRTDKDQGGRPFDKRKPSFKSEGRRPDAGRPTQRPTTRTPEREERKWDSEERIARSTRPRKSSAPKEDELIRLNRYIANAGICSRRKADELIQAGVVSVNGEVVSELGFKVNPAKDVIRYNGETLKREKMVYVLLNKPKDYITTTDDPQERRTVMQLVEKASKERIYPVGRLDRNTTGLLLMTNDGDLADKLSHPRNNIIKIYQVELNRNLTQGDFNKIQFGLELEDGLIKPDVVSYVQGGSKREIGIQIHSGKNRIVRRIFEHLGYEVVKLDRVVYANLTKKDLPRGRWRYLDDQEIIRLKHFTH